MAESPRHALQWSTQSNNYIPETNLPSNTTRHFIQTSEGPLELLIVEPPASQQRQKRALFLQHGVFGCASVWLPYAIHLSQLGYPCYALSLRGHGASWVPGIVKLWWTTKAVFTRDMVAGIEWATAEERRKQDSNTVSIVLVGHSMGGGLVQYALSKKLVNVTGLILCSPEAGSGILRAFVNLIRVDPFFVPRLLLHGLHPRTLLLTTAQAHRLFFSPQYPSDKLENLAQYFPESESMVCVLGMIPKFVDFRRVVQQSIVGLGGSKLDGERILILTGELDAFMDVRTMRRLAKHYREAVRHSIGENEGGLVSSFEGHEADKEEAYTEDRGDGVRMVVIRGAGHHVQNDLQWEVGAQRIVDFLQQL